MPLPNFIIAGAPKCGSTALWGYLAAHRDVFMTKNKEPHFFTKTQKEIAEGVIKPGPERSITYTKGFAWYEKLFVEGSEKKARGEASTHYFSAPDSSYLIHKSLPDIKLIFLLRDPVDRAYSHYWQDYKIGCPLPEFSEILIKKKSILLYYTYVSSYKIHLQRFFSFFDNNQIHIILYDDLKRIPYDVLNKVCNFLEISNRSILIDLGKNYNPYTVPKYRKLERIMTYLSYNKVANRLPIEVRSILGKFKNTIGRKNRKIDNYPELQREIRAELLPRFYSDIDYVESLLGRKLDSWRWC